MTDIHRSLLTATNNYFTKFDSVIIVMIYKYDNAQQC